MKIFVTVGTGKYDRLIREVDNIYGHDIVCQIGKGRYVPKSHRYIRFSEDLSGFYDGADIIISHAGIGTIFEVLHLGKRLIVVPNTDRTDMHQMEIVRRMQEEKVFRVCRKLSGLSDVISVFGEVVPYIRPACTISGEIKRFLSV